MAPGNTITFGTGISLEIPSGYCGLIFARSGLSCKNGLAPANKVGVVDEDYRGEIKVALHNHSKVSHCVKHGDRIAQFILLPVIPLEFEESDELSETGREDKGFGSTGTN